MAIIAFWNNEEKETGQTMSIVALSTYMAIEHNYRILNISTNYSDRTLENSYWNSNKQGGLLKGVVNSGIAQVGVGSGVEGLAQIINSNRTSINAIQNYTKVVFKDRLDVLCAPKAKSSAEYNPIARLYPDIIQLAERSYDLIFVDISNKMPKEQAKQILEFADVIVVNLVQRLNVIDNFNTLRENNEFFNKKNILINIGRYDEFSKYNIKNITRYMKLKKEINAIPYNTLFLEACSEGKVAELFLKLRRIELDETNSIFIERISKLSKDLIYKIQEMQLKS